MTDVPAPTRPAPVPWDLVVRLSHWLIAAAIVANAMMTKGGSVVHVWIGWIAMAVLAIRVAWGLVGSAEARFAAFPLNPAGAITHLRELAAGQVVSHRSHNPAGAMMIYALWASLAVVILTGLTLTGWSTPMEVAAQKAAAVSGDWQALAANSQPSSLSRETRHLVEEVHEVMVNLMVVLAAIHVVGVVVESRLTRRNLVVAMIRRVTR